MALRRTGSKLGVLVHHFSVDLPPTRSASIIGRSTARSPGATAIHRLVGVVGFRGHCMSVEYGPASSAPRGLWPPQGLPPPPGERSPAPDLP